MKLKLILPTALIKGGLQPVSSSDPERTRMMNKSRRINLKISVMKRIIALFYTVCISLNGLAQDQQTGICGDLINYIPASNVTIPVNFIFFKPLSGTGEFDGVTQTDCDAIINFMNAKWSNLLPTNHPAAAPYTALTGYTDSKIRFSFKSLSFKPDAQYNVLLSGGVGSQFPTYTVTDPNALNMVFNVHPNAGPAGAADGIGSNKITLLKSPGSPFDHTDSGTRHLYFLHEVGHALGLEHTHPVFNTTPPPPLNPTGAIPSPPPVDDCWYEDANTYVTHGNNYMGEVWAARDYLSPKQIGYIHYMLKTHPVVSNMVAQANCTPGSDWTMSSGTYPGPIYPDADLIIPQGSHVIFTGCVFMKPNTRIIVEPGGKLSINAGGNVMRACASSWRGIEVHSSSASLQMVDPITDMPANATGMLVINKGKVDGAEIAVNVGKYNSTGTYFIPGCGSFPGSYIPHTAGGIVRIDQALFTNNRLAVNFNPFFILASNSPNQSYIRYSTFVCDNSYVNTNDPFAGINMNTTYGIKVLGCRFFDYIKKSYAAIRCVNGSVVVAGDAVTSQQTQIRNFKYGIYLNSWLTNIPGGLSSIRNVWIEQTSNVSYGGIYAMGTFGTEVVDCDIKISPPSTPTGLLSYGIYLDGCDGYVIENNLIRGATSAYQTGGIFVNNSGTGANYIYNNTFKYLQQGIWAQNINYDHNSIAGAGLKMNCNDFSNSQYNIGVQTMFMGPNCSGCPTPFQIGGIAKTQGVHNLLEKDNVRNTYGTTNCTNENKFFINTQNSFSTIHGSFAGAQYHPTPPCSDPLEVIGNVGTAPSTPRTNWCPANVYQDYSKAALSVNLSTTRSNISSLAASLDQTLDGGDTQALLSMFLNTSSTVNDIYDTLISKDYLSDEVLTTFFQMPGLNDSQIENMFIKNAPVSAAVWAVVQTLVLPATVFDNLNDIQFNQNLISARELVRSQLTLAETELGLLNNESIRRFLKDTTGIAYDSIADIYARNELPNSAFKLLDLAIATGHYSQAQAMITTLSSNTANEDHCAVLGHILALRQDNTYAETMRLDTLLYNYLHSAAGSTRPMLDTYIKSILEDVYYERENEITLQPAGVEPIEQDEDNARPSVSGIEDKSVIVESINEKFIRIYPNPASDHLTIENNDTLESVQIKIIDMSGKLFVEQACEKSCVIDLGNLSNGIYMIHLSQRGRFLNAKKLVIVK